MTWDPDVLNDLEAAATERRTARRGLREKIGSLARAIAMPLRAGDKAKTRRARYTLEKVTWRALIDGDPDHELWDEGEATVLVRTVKDESVALWDPRDSWVDNEGIMWQPKPGPRAVYLVNTLDGDDAERVYIAQDDELIAFADEAADVAAAFAKVLRNEAEQLRGYVEPKPTKR